MTCHRCGKSLHQLRSVASDAHDEPACYCPCWPTDWPCVAVQVATIALLVTVLVTACYFMGSP